MGLHSNLGTADGIHIPYAWTYSGQVEREAASGFVSSDIGKFARQLDDNSIWMLVSTVPLWSFVGADSGIPSHANTHKISGVDSIRLDELAEPIDNENLNSTVERHGLLKKLSGVSNEYLNGQGNWALVQSVFGSDFQLEESLSESSTTSNVWQDKITLNTPSLDGLYRIAFSCEWLIDNSGARGPVRIYNVTDDKQESICDFRGVQANIYYTLSGLSYITFTGSSKQFKFQWQSWNNTSGVSIRNARLELWRVS